jgi:hypothetical protein
MSDSQPTQQDREQFLQYLGKRAVFRETGSLIPVTIEEIRFEPDFEAKLAAVDGIVLSSSFRVPKGAPIFSVSAAWDYLRVEHDSWSFTMPLCVWRVILNETACDAVVRVCKERPGLDPDVLFKLADCVSKNPAIVNNPAALAELERHFTESLRSIIDAAMNAARNNQSVRE